MRLDREGRPAGTPGFGGRQSREPSDLLFASWVPGLRPKQQETQGGQQMRPKQSPSQCPPFSHRAGRGQPTKAD